MNSFAFVILAAAAFGAAAVDAANYCDASLCGSRKHIACGHNGQFAASCPADAKMVAMTPALQQALVDAHNAKRNYVASGADPNHDPACRMATMKWDDELASIAALNVKQCAMKHDACRNTATFKMSGQNLFWSSYFGKPNDQNMLQKAVTMWFDEIKDSNMDVIHAYPSNFQGPTIGHFTVMSVDSNTRVGCAAATYSMPNGSSKSYLVACNYATTNILDQYIYKSCPTPAFKCKSGTNPSYRNLCSAAEKIDPNQWRQ